jgi:hypothetical protein
LVSDAPEAAYILDVHDRNFRERFLSKLAASGNPIQGFIAVIESGEYHDNDVANR